MPTNLMRRLENRKYFLVAFAFILCFLVNDNTLFAQTSKTLIKGVVTSSDENEPLPGVSILVKGTSNGTTTNIDGEYNLEVPENATLVYSYIGFLDQEVVVSSQTTIDIVLELDVEQLDEVVVIGYGTQKKSHLTGAVSKVTNEKLDQIPLSRVDDALAGQVSGINIQMTNPAAGEAPTIRVRGNGSITSFPNPLVVVDGLVVDSDYLGSVDMNDVESVEVLKDAASAAIYGSRGANGVIMITTKKGKAGNTVFSYNGYVGVKAVPESDVLSSISDWNNYVRANNNGELIEKLEYIEQLGTETNWEEVMMDGGVIQSHSISARGGSENTKFSLSGSYLSDEGVLLTDSYEKINFRLNLETKLGKRLTFGLRVNPSYSKQRRFPIGVHDAIRQSPWLPQYIDETNEEYINRLRDSGAYSEAEIGDYAWERMFDNYDLEAGEPVESGGTSISTTSNASPLAKVLERERLTYRTKIYTNAYLKYKIAKGLNFRSTIGGDVQFRRNRDYIGTLSDRRGSGGTSAADAQRTQYHIVTEQMFTYDKEIGNHSINAVAGFAFESWNVNETDIDAAGYNFDYVTTIPSTNVTGAYTYEDAETLVSYLGRVNYAYADKYLVSLSARTDGSSKFGPDNKFGFFPAVSVGWRVSEESFLMGNSILSDLKVRASYGMTGNNAGIGRYAHIGQVEPIGSVLDGNIYGGFNQTTLSNPELRWEKSIEFNPGIDFGFLDNRFRFTIEYYNRTSDDLLIQQPIPSATGFTEAVVNLGKVENEGLEMEIFTTNINSGDFKWTTTGNLSNNKNTLLDFAGAEGLISVVDSKRPAEWIAEVGQPVASFYGYVVDKEIPLNYLKNPFYPINAESQDIYVKDLNGDGLIDTDDRTILGSPFPKLIWSITNNFNYKNFDMSFMFQGSHGAKVRNMDPQYVNNQFSSNQDYITDSDDPNFFPDAAQVQQRIFTDDIVMDASYIALRNLNVGYKFSSQLIDKVGMNSARVYVAAQNLLYIMGSDYRGYNPEGINEGLDSPLTYGYQRGAAPIYRTWSVGVNLEF
ncbi:TonB-dependent receptor [Flammeovirgaceae bacterium SG7u.111]|nr:TonB-dependent receptor [Flammeovirgaceae bacterium SG7u.132]WPO33234.1 TonB-dependent receptor [Flammeovirgaceae bacterium SG7u.111]